MKTLAYLDCPTGISGDMCLGALVHAGVPLPYLKEQLAKLCIGDEFDLSAETVRRNQQAATKVHVNTPVNLTSQHQLHHHTHLHEHPPSHFQSRSQSHLHSGRKLPEIERLIQQADLPKQATEWSLAVFRKLATAEGTVHGIAPDQVHFHEVGATDAIVDIVGTCLGLDWLNIDRIVCAPLPTGGGTVRCAHGLLPVPVPAVLAMMAQANMPIYSNQIEQELVTPTGCAIAITLSESFGPPPRFTLQKVGLGAGGRDLPIPNILRLWIGIVSDDSNHQIQAHQVHTHQAHTHQAHTHHDADKEDRLTTSTDATDMATTDIATTDIATTDIATTGTTVTDSPEAETIVELQTQIDDCSPQAIGFVFERLFSVGAVDVFTQGVAMKKNRLGILLTVICPPAKLASCEAVLFAETTTLGIRQTWQKRTALDRKMVSVATAYGEIAVKLGLAKGELVNVQPEYEDVAKGARSHHRPWKEVHQAAMKAAVDQLLAPTCLD